MTGSVGMTGSLSMTGSLRGRRRAAGLLAAMLTPLLVVLAAAPAQATSYRYWSYWHGTGSGGWSYSTVGPAGYGVSDGDVEGWRMAVSTDGSGARPAASGGAATFSAACGGVAAGSGRIRVAVVLDFGVATDARPGDSVPSPRVQTRCVQLDASASGADALVAAANGAVRSSGGLVCGIKGYPSAGCGEVVTTRASSAPRTSSAAPSKQSSVQQSPVPQPSAKRPSSNAAASTSSPSKPRAASGTSGTAASTSAGSGGPSSSAAPGSSAASPSGSATPDAGSGTGATGSSGDSALAAATSSPTPDASNQAGTLAGTLPGTDAAADGGGRGATSFAGVGVALLLVLALAGLAARGARMRAGRRGR